MISVAARLWLNGRVKEVLIIAPRAMTEGWLIQLEKHLKVPYRFYNFQDQQKESEDHIDDEFDGITFLAVSYGYFWRREWIINRQWDMVALDESHRIKQHTTKQALGAMAIKARYRFAMTGTPIEHNEVDLFSQFRFIDPTILGTNYWAFMGRYGRKIEIADTGIFKWDLKKASAKKIRTITKPSTFRVRQSDVLKLPGSYDEVVQFPLTGKAKTTYKNMENNFYMKNGGKVSSSHIKITSLIRLQQITGGFVSNDDGTIIQLNQDKLVAFMDIMEDIPKHKKIVIFSRFVQEIRMIKEAVKKTGRTVGVIRGKTKSPGKVWRKFQEKSNPNTIILQCQSGGEGIELFRSHICFFYSVTYSYVKYHQMRGRLDRPGQEKRVRFIHLLGKNTIDTDIKIILNNKGHRIDGILEAMQHRRGNYGKSKQRK